MKKNLLSLFVASCLIGNMFAQDSEEVAVGTAIGSTKSGLSHFSLGIKGGIDYLRKSDKKINPEFGGFLEVTVNPLWGLGLEYMYLINNHGVAKWRDAPAFDESVQDVTLFGSINLSNLVAKYRSHGWQKLNVYLNAGGGISIYDLKLKESGSKENGVRAVFLSGFQVEYNISKHFALGLESQYRWHTDEEYVGSDGGTSIAGANLSIRYKFGGERNVRNLALVNYDPRIAVSNAPVAVEDKSKENELAKLENKVTNQDVTIQKLQSQLKDVQDSLKKLSNKPTQGTKYIPTKEELLIIKTAFSQLEFESGKDVIKQSSYTSLDGLAALLIQHPEWSVVLKGYTDSSGNADKNLQLSKDRSNSVKKYLVNKGASASTIQTFGYGSADPVATNNTIEGRAQNRRVEIDLYSK